MRLPYLTGVCTRTTHVRSARVQSKKQALWALLLAVPSCFLAQSTANRHGATMVRWSSVSWSSGS